MHRLQHAHHIPYSHILCQLLSNLLSGLHGQPLQQTISRISWSRIDSSCAKASLSTAATCSLSRSYELIPMHTNFVHGSAISLNTKYGMSLESGGIKLTKPLGLVRIEPKSAPSRHTQYPSTGSRLQQHPLSAKNIPLQKCSLKVAQGSVTSLGNCTIDM